MGAGARIGFVSGRSLRGFKLNMLVKMLHDNLINIEYGSKMNRQRQLERDLLFMILVESFSEIKLLEGRIYNHDNDEYTLEYHF